jgi:hypothetical protein
MTAAYEPGLRFGRAHHARRQFGLADALPARQRRVVLLHRRLQPHLTRHLLEIIIGVQGISFYTWLQNYKPKDILPEISTALHLMHWL